MPPKSNNKSMEDSKASKNDTLKKKSSRACISCRKRKVKCDGLFPCERCSKAETQCVYDKPQPKKDPAIKQTIQPTEARLSRIEEFSQHLSNVIDSSSTCETDTVYLSSQSQLQFDDIIKADQKLFIEPSGRALFTKAAASKQHQSLYPQPQQSQPILFNLISIYFQFIDPVIPIMHRPTFFQLLQNNRISDLLLSAIYCVSSRWDIDDQPAFTNHRPSRYQHEQPRGWSHYQNAIQLLDKEMEPNIATLQAIFLLLKYSEHVRRHGFTWRTIHYHKMLVRMCKDATLLPSAVEDKRNDAQLPETAIDAEMRKRLFWAIYCYDIMQSAETGTLPHFNMTTIRDQDLPTFLHDETIDPFQEHEKISHFLSSIRIIHVQANILHYLHSKHNQLSPSALISNHILTEETLEIQLKATLNLITCTIPLPTRQSMRYTACFLYLICNFTLILLYQHSNTDRCREPALHIKQLIELILECNAFEDMYCSIRGIQQIIHYLSASNSIFMKLNMQEELQQTLQLSAKLASISPLTELVSTR